eukprot:m.288926 g.288926  ORF g.288926 m.288926 type:complete len:300 (-) comp12043_c0_seq1:441-1340(-)
MYKLSKQARERLRCEQIHSTRDIAGARVEGREEAVWGLGKAHIVDLHELELVARRGVRVAARSEATAAVVVERAALRKARARHWPRLWGKARIDWVWSRRHRAGLWCGRVDHVERRRRRRRRLWVLSQVRAGTGVTESLARAVWADSKGIGQNEGATGAAARHRIRVRGSLHGKAAKDALNAGGAAHPRTSKLFLLDDARENGAEGGGGLGGIGSAECAVRNDSLLQKGQRNARKVRDKLGGHNARRAKGQRNGANLRVDVGRRAPQHNVRIRVGDGRNGLLILLPLLCCLVILLRNWH